MPEGTQLDSIPDPRVQALVDEGYTMESAQAILTLAPVAKNPAPKPKPIPKSK